MKPGWFIKRWCQLCHIDRVTTSCHADRDIRVQRCVVGLRRLGEPEGSGAAKEVLTVWFPPMATMAAVLSEDNQSRLRLSRDKLAKSRQRCPNSPGDKYPTCRAGDQFQDPDQLMAQMK